MPPDMSLISSKIVKITRYRQRCRGFFLAVVCLSSIFSHSQHSARTISRGLDQLTEEADVIVHGYVTSTRIEPHPQLHNLNTMLVTLEVKDTYKGTAHKSL